MAHDAPDFEREVRFAVVIYGGVSLAVYINGIVQEMLHMVRATAPAEGPRAPSEEVYRKLACLLSPSGGLSYAPDGTLAPPGRSPRTKFVVDVLSGTSAGGINAVYLAKALANNQSLQQLAMMWINVADIAKLLNDGGSAEAPVSAQVPPKSLLNSHWMYLKLLEALDGMEESHGPPLVEDLDLFSTTTDIDGVALPIALADKQVFEFRHRNVFHFQTRAVEGEVGQTWEGGRNDFTSDNNPFLAYAARCTSAFPFAFEPMALCDIFDIIQRLPAHEGQSYCSEDTSYWQRFYEEYIRDADPNRETVFRFRSFGDGGYLDNKPFSYAIDTIMKRNADVPVDRKLIYVEPSPEDIGKTEKKRRGASDRPDAVENSLAALIDLPRYETIRQDLERVLEWNRNVARIRRVMSDPDVLWATADIRQHKEGVSYQFYLRLRLSSVTDLVGSQVAKALALDPNSARGEAIRGLAGSWRVAHAISAEDRSAFLGTYDVAYLRRALQFLRAYLLQRRSLERGRRDLPASEWHSIVRYSGILRAAKRRLQRFAEQPLPDLTGKSVLTADQLLTQAEERKRDLECAVNAQFAAEVWHENGLPPAAFGGNDAARQLRLDFLMRNGWENAITEADRILRAHFQELHAIRDMLTPVMHFWDADGWERFDVHDSVMFPVLFGTNVEETTPIDVIRISPDDVADLAGIDEMRGRGPKLKGQQFGAFGGFFDLRWRLHDMLRGRLHAAERLITAILPAADADTIRVREALIVEAQSAIARDWNDNFASYLPQEATNAAAEN